MTRKRNKLLSTLVAFSMALGLLNGAAFADGGGEDSVAVKVGETVTLTGGSAGAWQPVEEEPAGLSPVWSSSDGAVAAVSGGDVTGAAAGTAVITKLEYAWEETGENDTRTYHEAEEGFDHTGMALVFREITWTVAVTEAPPPDEGDDGEYTVKPGMTQGEIDTAVAGQTAITVKPGNYGEGNVYKCIKLTADAAVTLIPGTYEHFHLIVDNGANVTIEAGSGVVLKGQDPEGVGSNGNGFYYGDCYTGILVKAGTLNLGTDLTLTDYNMALKLGVGGGTDPVALNVSDGATLTIRDSHQTTSPQKGDKDYWGGGMEEGDGVTMSQGHGATGSGIFVTGYGEVAVNVTEGAVLNAAGNWGGLYATHGKLTIRVDEAAVHFDDSTGWDGIYSCDDKTNTWLRLDLTNRATVTCDRNCRNGITAQGDPANWLLTAKDSALTCNGNRSIGMNNLAMVLTDSTVTVSGNGSHGATNVALDAENSAVTCNGNKYLGLNISMVNVGKAKTSITGGSRVTVNDNGGAGIRFFVTGGTVISGSEVTALGNGVGESLYGYAVKPGDSGYWADVAAKATVDASGSTVTAGTWSLYNSGSAKLPSVWMLGDGGNVARVLYNADFEDAKDIFDDVAATVAGRTVLTSGSLKGTRLHMSGTAEFDSLNPAVYLDEELTLLKEDGAAVYAAPVNNFGTALTMFKVTNEYQSIPVYDPNEKARYTYPTAYDEETDWVWAPVAVVHYDATEGTIDAPGTAQRGGAEAFLNLDDGSRIGCAATDSAAGWEVSDYTISGAALETLNRTLPTAAREGYRFGGWYYVADEDVDAAAGAAARGDWAALYALFAGEFTGKTPVAEEDSQITVYAKWVRQYTVTVRYFDTDGNVIAQEYRSGGLDENAPYDMTAQKPDTIAFGGGTYDYSYKQGHDLAGALDGDKVIDLYYARRSSGGGGGGTTTYYTITVHYYDKDTGASIAESYSQRKARGSAYDVTAKNAIDIAGYTYDSTSGDPLKGTLNSSKVINVYYTKEAEIPVEPPVEPVDPEVPVDPEPPIDPEAPVDPAPPVEPEIPVEPQIPEESQLPQTGQSWWPVWLLAGVGALLVLMGVGKKKRTDGTREA